MQGKKGKTLFLRDIKAKEKHF